MEKQEIVIRILKKEDAQNISDTFNAANWPKPVEQYLKYFDEQQQGTRLVLLSFYLEEFSGYLTINWKPEYNIFKNQNIPEICDLNVLQKYRRKGIATNLMDHAEREIIKISEYSGLGVGLYADYGPAQRMYILRGYIPDTQGIMYNNQSVSPGTQVLVDDNLTIQMIKKLSN